jgi:NADH-quinone oxidoreductase subunit N
MFIGNLLALMQTNVKRILAYSSIAHLGYLLVAFLASGSLAAVAGAYYLAAYFVTTLGAFGVIAVLSGPDRDADRIDEYRGLFWRRPWIAGIFTAMLLSLAGIPFTAGFIGKFYVLDAGEQSGRWLAVFALVINSAIGIFYYLRIVVALYMPATDADSRLASALSRTGVATLAALTVLLFSMGVYPTPIIRLVETFIAHAAVLP